MLQKSKVSEAHILMSIIGSQKIQDRSLTLMVIDAYKKQLSNKSI